MNREAEYKLDPNETVDFEIRKHWIAIAPTLISAGFLVLIALLLAYIIGRYPAVFGPALPLITVLALLFVVLAGAIAAVGWWVFRQNKLILTNLHLIQIEQSGLFHRTVSQLSLARVQDVTGSTRGLAQTLLGFGDVVVQTAGEQEKFTFELAPKPATIADHCLQAHEDFVNDNPDREL
jgi:uncharacterized membrane protein YdbT with pleckstrin-like domain